MPENDQLIPFLKQSEIFHNFSEEELKVFLPFIQTTTVPKDQFIFHEGDQSSELYIVQRGQVAILFEDEEQKSDCPVATILPGNSFGEMTILTENIRFAGSKALEETDLLVLKFDNFHELVKTNPIFAKFSLSLSKQISKWLKSTNEMAMKATKEELRLTKIHDHMGKFIIHLFILLSLFFYVFKLFIKHGDASSIIQWISTCLILGLTISGIFLIKNSGYPIQFYGLTLKNWKNNCWEAILFTIPVLLFMTGLRWIVISIIPAFKNFSLIQIGNQSTSFFSFFENKESLQHFFIFLALYSAFIPLQEFITRGCLQTCLYNFFRSPKRGLLAIISSNLIFDIFHGLETISFMGVALLLGLFWGWLYQRQNSIIGPSLSHILIGIWGFGFLDYKGLLIY